MAAIGLELELASDRVTVGETVYVVLRLINDGEETISVPHPYDTRSRQPVLTVRGPAAPDGAILSHGRRLEHEDVEPTVESGIKEIQIPPGEEHEDELPLSDWLALDVPGAYEIGARFRWAGYDVRAEPLALEVLALEITAIDVRVDAHLPTAGNPEVAWLQPRGAEQLSLYSGLFHEERPDLGEFDTPLVRPIARVDAEARELLTPWANRSRGGCDTWWFAWRCGDELCARDATYREPRRLPLPTDSWLVRPGVLSADETLEVFVASDAPPRIGVARFPTADAGGDPELLWLADLPAPPTGARASVAPYPAGDVRHAVVVVPEVWSVTLVHVACGAGAPGARIRSRRLRGIVPIEGSHPGVRVGNDGAVSAAVLCAHARDRRRLALLELTWAADGDVRSWSSTDLGPRPADVVEATAAYTLTPHGVARREWAAVLDDGRWLFSRRPASPRASEATIARPLQLLPLSMTSYLLVIDPASGPRFLAI